MRRPVSLHGSTWSTTLVVLSQRRPPKTQSHSRRTSTVRSRRCWKKPSRSTSPSNTQTRPSNRLLADDFYEDAVGEGSSAEDVDDAVFGEAAEHGVGLGVGVGWGFGFGWVGGGFDGWWCGLAGA